MTILPGPLGDFIYSAKSTQVIPQTQSTPRRQNFKDGHWLQQWQTAFEVLDLDDITLIESISVETVKVPRMLLLIKELKLNEFDVGLILKDASCEVNGILQKTLADEYSKTLVAGSCLELVNVSLFRPNAFKFYIVVTRDSIQSMIDIHGERFAKYLTQGLFVTQRYPSKI